MDVLRPLFNDSSLLVLDNFGLVILGGGVGASLLEFSSLDPASYLFRSIFGTLNGTKLFGGKVVLLNFRAGSCGNALRFAGDRGGGVGGSVNLYKFPLLEFPLAKLLLLFVVETLSVLVSKLLVNESSRIVGLGAVLVLARGLALKIEISRQICYTTANMRRMYYTIAY